MSDSGKAVFLSYASQDSEAARRICEALRAAGIEVWFDQSELRGGDAWDAKIRKQIKECTLFMPIISANTQARHEGYFRLEWHLAEQRSHLIARGRPFIVPIAIDETSDADALVPDAFLAVQWMRLPRGEASAEFWVRIKSLLTGDGGAAMSRSPVAFPGPPSTAAAKRTSVLRMLIFGCLGIVSVLVAGVIAIVLIGHSRQRSPEDVAKLVAASESVWKSMDQGAAVSSTNRKTVSKAPEPESAVAAGPRLSPARELTQRAQQILDQGSLTRVQLDAAGELCDRAVQLDPTDPLVWATAADVELRYVYPYGYDRSDERRRRAQERAARATSLGPDLPEVRLIQAEVFAHAVGTPALMAEAEKTIRALHAARLADPELVRQLAEVLREEKRFDEAAELFESVHEFEVAGWSYFQAGELRQALAVLARAPRSATALQLRTMLEYSANEDLHAAEATVNQFEPSELLAEMPATIAIRVAMYRRDPARMLELAQGMPNDFIRSNAFSGPRRYFTGLAQAMAGRPALAESEWRAALKLVQTMLKATPDDRVLLQWSAWLHAALHDTAEAERDFARGQALAGLNGETMETSDFEVVFSQIHVLMQLHKSDALLAGLENVFRAKLPDWELVHAEMRFGPEADYLRGDPRFEKLLRENLPSGAVPFEPMTAKPK